MSRSELLVAVILLAAALNCQRPREQNRPTPQVEETARTDAPTPAPVRAPSAALHWLASTDLVPGVRVTPSVWVDSVGPMLRATATLRSSRRDTVRLTFGGCPIEVRAYRIPSEDGRPVWRLSESRPLCPAVEMRVTLAPRDTTTLRTAAPVASMKDVSPIEPGRYAFTITVRAVEPAVTTPELAAGDVRIP
jgi:hypothetical protein